MARRSTTAEATRYLVADDDPAPGDLLNGAILRCRVIDELTLKAPGAPVMIESSAAGLTKRVAGAGLCGLVGIARHAASALLRPGTLTMAVTAPGYLRRDLTPAIDAARRTLTAPAPAGSTNMTVAPPDPSPRLQFGAGRGVLLERTAPAQPDQFTTVADSAAPPPAQDVPLAVAVSPARGIGARVAGVPLSLPDQPLHRERTLALRGRVQRHVGPNTLAPAVGAQVMLTGLWWDYPAAVASAPQPPEICAMEPPLRFAYPAGAPVHSCTLTPTGATAVLREASAAGADAILVAPNGVLNPAGGDLLRIGDPIGGEDEVVVTAGFDPASDPSAPVRVRLRTPPGIIHRAGAPIALMLEGAVAPVGAVAREAQPGDAVLFAPNMAALPTVATLIVGRLTPQESYHRARQYPVAVAHLVPVDATGRLEWPTIGRVAQMRIVVSLPPSPPVQRDFALDYGGDLTLSVILA